MARRPVSVEVPEDTRPIGSLLFADSSKAEFARHIHEFNDPRSPNAKPEGPLSIRTVTARETTYWDPKRTGHHDEVKD